MRVSKVRREGDRIQSVIPAMIQSTWLSRSRSVTGVNIQRSGCWAPCQLLRYMADNIQKDSGCCQQCQRGIPCTCSTTGTSCNTVKSCKSAKLTKLALFVYLGVCILLDLSMSSITERIRLLHRTLVNWFQALGLIFTREFLAQSFEFPSYRWDNVRCVPSIHSGIGDDLLLKEVCFWYFHLPFHWNPWFFWPFSVFLFL